MPIFAQFQAVKRKLDSKNDALLILSKDITDAHRDRDHYKLIADQLRQKYKALKSSQLHYEQVLPDKQTFTRTLAFSKVYQHIVLAIKPYGTSCLKFSDEQIVLALD